MLTDRLGGPAHALASQCVRAFRANVARSALLSIVVAACAAACFFETYTSAKAARIDEAAARLAGRDVIQVEAVGLSARACNDIADLQGVDATLGIKHLGDLVIGTPTERQVRVEAVAGSIADFFHVSSDVVRGGVVMGSDLSDSISDGAQAHTLLLPQLSDATPAATADATPAATAAGSGGRAVRVESLHLPPMARNLSSSLIVAASPRSSVDACLIAMAPPVDPKAPAMIQGFLGSKATLSSVAWLTSGREAYPQDRYSSRVARFAPFALVALVALVQLLHVRSRRREFALYRVNGVNGAGVFFMQLVDCCLMVLAAVVGWTVTLSTLALVDATAVDLPAARLGLQNAVAFTALMFGIVPLFNVTTLRASPWAMLREP